MRWIENIVNKLKDSHPAQQPGDWAAMEALIQKIPQLQPRKTSAFLFKRILLGLPFLVALLYGGFLVLSPNSQPNYSPRNNSNNFENSNVKSAIKASTPFHEFFHHHLDSLQKLTVDNQEKFLESTPLINVSNQTTVVNELPKTPPNEPFASGKQQATTSLLEKGKRYGDESTLLTFKRWKLWKFQPATRSGGIITDQSGMPLFQGSKPSRGKQYLPLPTYLMYSAGTAVAKGEFAFTQEASLGWDFGAIFIESGVGQSRLDRQPVPITNLQQLVGNATFTSLLIDSTWHIIHIYQGEWRYDTTRVVRTDSLFWQNTDRMEREPTLLRQWHVPFRIGYRHTRFRWEYGISLGGIYTRSYYQNTRSDFGEAPNIRVGLQAEIRPYISRAITDQWHLKLLLEWRTAEQNAPLIWYRMGVQYRWK